MNSLSIAAVVLTTVFAGGAIGLQLHRFLPESYTTAGARDMTGAVVGLVTLLLALVLGLLIWTAYGVFSGQKLSIQTLAVSGLKFDAAMVEYGPEAAEGRSILRAGLKRTVDHVWGANYDGNFVIRNYGYALADLKEREAYLGTLEPTSEPQKAAKVAAMQAATAIAKTRVEMTLGMIDAISYPLLGVVVAWAGFLFLGYGLLSKPHPMSYIVLAVGALAIASSIYIIIDLSSPYSGAFQVSAAPIVDVLAAVEEAGAPAGAHR